MSIDTSKIIHAPVGGGRYTVTAPIVKEDYGLYLLIEGLELPSTYEVDFSNSEHNGTSVTMIGNSDGVLIPSQFISSGKDVFAFLYHVGVDFGRTVYKFRIPNKLRPDRTDETPTPEEQSVIDQAISALNSAVAQTAQDVIDADASAQSASQSADRAEEAKTDAQNYATQAEQSATDAQTSASQASASATASAQSASEAQSASTNAETYALNSGNKAVESAQSATASANSASQASASATSASQSATSAQGYASQAQTSAQTASTKASEASTSAGTASAKATESAQSASQALTYKTDAEQAKTASQTAQASAEQAKTDAISAKEDAESARDEAQSIVDGISAKAEQIDSNTERIESLEDDRYKPYAVDSASGAIASFVDGADDIPLKSLIVNIDPVQDTSSGDPSPENICPISGWTGCEIQHDGKNLLPMPIVSGSYNYTTVIAVNDDKSFTITKTNGNGWSSFILGRFMLKQGVYTLIESDDDSSNAQLILDKVIGDTTETLLTTRYAKRITFTVEADTLVQARYLRSATADNVLTKLMLFVGNTATATDYEPYQGQTIPISWQTEAGTVYGGKLDVLSGVLTVEYARKRVNSDLGSVDFNTSRVRYTVLDAMSINTETSIRDTNIMCSHFPKVSASSIAGCRYSYGGDYERAFILFQRIDTFGITNTLDGWNAFLADNNVYVTYKLKTPITYQLTPHEVNSLLGVNNIFADTGDTSAEYRADTTLYIQRLTDPDADMIADSNITSGQYFMVGNNLYKATANIASGGQVIVGTNAIRKSLSEALNEINS